jgi:hypothetical protein
MANTQFLRDSQDVDLQRCGNIRISNLTGKSPNDLYFIPTEEYDDIAAIQDEFERHSVMLTYAIAPGQTKAIAARKYRAIVTSGVVGFLAWSGTRKVISE